VSDLDGDKLATAQSPTNAICNSTWSRAAFSVPELASCAVIRSRSSIGNALAFFFGRPCVSVIPDRTRRYAPGAWAVRSVSRRALVYLRRRIPARHSLRGDQQFFKLIEPAYDDRAAA
jgi:hypothetical protein